MKILLVIVVLIAAFKADCRHFPDEPTNQVSTSDEHPLPDEPVNSDFTVDDQYNKYSESSLVEDVNEQDEITLRGKGGKNNLQKLIKKVEFLKYNLTQDNLKMKMELQFLRDNQHNISDTNTKHSMLVLSKMANISNGGKQLKIELQSIKDQQNNMTNADKELKMELNFVIKNITNGDLQLKEDIQSILDHQHNITDSNSGLKNDVNTMQNNMNSYNSNIVSKLNNISSKLDTIAAQGCPRDCFTIPSSRQCFKYFADVRRNWITARSKCQTEGLELAKPSDPITLRNYMVSNYGSSTYLWLGARGNGSYIKWLRDGTQITKSNQYWWPGHPYGVTTSDCLELYVYGSHPKQPYVAHKCTTAKNTLCEFVRG